MIQKQLLNRFTDELLADYRALQDEVESSFFRQSSSILSMIHASIIQLESLSDLDPNRADVSQSMREFKLAFRFIKRRWERLVLSERKRQATLCPTPDMPEMMVGIPA